MLALLADCMLALLALPGACAASDATCAACEGGAGALVGGGLASSVEPPANEGDERAGNEDWRRGVVVADGIAVGVERLFC